LTGSPSDQFHGNAPHDVLNVESIVYFDEAYKLFPRPWISRYTGNMQYRTFPKIPDLEISALGLGAMRLPVLNGDSGAIDETAYEGMIRMAARLGINYLDTAYVYHHGHSESATGRVLERSGLRDKFLIATKSPLWDVKSVSDWDRFLDEQLSRLKTDHIDFYLLHAIDKNSWATVVGLKGLEAMEKAKADGRIRHLGFSFHDSLDVFKEVVDAYDGWEFCQVQYNYLDIDYQAGREGISYASARNIGVIVMEPLRGGGLADLPPEAMDIFGQWPGTRSPAGWALRFVLDPQEVTLVLSGMGTENQLEENARVAGSTPAKSMTAEEMELYKKVRNYFKGKMPVPCTTCGYCMPCPHGVSIPEVFSIYNTAIAFESRLADRKGWYESGYRSHGHGGDACIACGDCLERCPQHIAIPDRLAEAHGFLKA